MLTKASSDEEKQALKPVLDWENYQLEQMKSKYENLEEKVEKMEEVGLFPCGSKILKHSSEKCDGDQQDVQHLEKLLYKYIFEEAIKLNVYNSHLKKRMVELNTCASKITVECNKEKLYKSIDALVAKYERSLHRQGRLLAIMQTKTNTTYETNLLTYQYAIFLAKHPELGSVLYNLGIKYAIEPKPYNEFDVDDYKATRPKCEYKELSKYF
jgi:ribosome-associated translation inhibitor RaiA